MDIIFHLCAILKTPYEYFRFTIAVKIGQNKIPLRGVSFCPFPTNDGYYFATCGSNMVCIFHAKRNGETTAIQSYADEDHKASQRE
eukprot:jgi/Galph1/2468/GphlegSOOS_G1111.1